jgi:hypothetical protein
MASSDVEYLAEALRTYETLSLNALPSIPSGSRLIGRLDQTGGSSEEPDLSYTQKLALKLLYSFPSLADLLRGFKPYIETHQLLRHMLSGMLYRLSSMGLFYGAIGYMARSSEQYELSPNRKVQFMELTTGNLGFRELD